MSESEGRHGALTAALTAALAVAYFFVCAEPLSPELSAAPRWKSYVTDSTPRSPIPGADPAFGFSVGRRYGYFKDDGSFRFVAESAELPAVSDSAFAVSTKDGRTAIRAPDGTELGSAQGMKPFFAGGRLYSAGADGTGLSAFGASGERLWTYSFPCQLSAFDSGDALAVGGTVDGWLEGVGPDGRKVFSFSPGGSRLPVVLGLSVSDGGDWIAAVTGLDRQRLVVLGKGGSDYRVASHRYLDSDFREPVRVVVLEDGRHVLYRRSDGIGVWSTDGAVDEVLPVKADDFQASIDEKHGIALLLAKSGRARTLAAWSLPSTLLGTLSLPESTEFARIEGSTVYLGAADWVARLDFVEE